MTEPRVQVTASGGARIRYLRQGRQWTVQAAAGKAGVPATAWRACEAGQDIAGTDYRAILGLFGLTESAVQFIERAARGGD